MVDGLPVETCVVPAVTQEFESESVGSLGHRVFRLMESILLVPRTPVCGITGPECCL